MPECTESQPSAGSEVTRPYTAPPPAYATAAAANLFGSIPPAGLANIMFEQCNRAIYNVPTATSYHWLVYKRANGSRYVLKFEKGAVKSGPQQRRYKCTACAVPFEIRVVDGKCYTSVDPDTEFAVDGKQHTAACVRQEDPSMLEGSRKRRSTRASNKQGK
ncbi:hypothetical protein AAVH_04223 [Aphelenchoides avenae]|nr:hypothetical protein AAVH_04223 [Aphelenchus avenae]